MVRWSRLLSCSSQVDHMNCLGQQRAAICQMVRLEKYSHPGTSLFPLSQASNDHTIATEPACLRRRCHMEDTRDASAHSASQADPSSQSANCHPRREAIQDHLVSS